MVFNCFIERQAESGVKARFPDNAESADSCKGFRSISTSADGHYLAAGDRSGNLYIYDLHSLQIISCKVSLLRSPSKGRVGMLQFYYKKMLLLLTANLSGGW